MNGLWVYFFGMAMNLMKYRALVGGYLLESGVLW